MCHLLCFPTRRSSDLSPAVPQRSNDGPIVEDCFGAPNFAEWVECDGRNATRRFNYEGEGPRSEEHTSELQSPCNLVGRLLLDKKNKSTHTRSSISDRD